MSSMPDFKVVVSDPEAPKNERVIRVKIEGDSEVEFTDRMKEGFELPVIKTNSKTASEIGAVHGVATLRIRRPDTGDKVKITGRIVVDDSVPDYVVKVNSELLIDKTGQGEIEGEVFRARAWQVRVSGEKATPFVGLKIGDYVDGSIIGLKGVKLVVTGGSDSSGIPMRPDVPGPVKKRIILSTPPGFHPREEGERRRKIIRGNTIAPDTVQINVKISYK